MHSITFQNILDLRCGIVRRVRVGILPPQIANRVGSIYRQEVWLSTESYHHIRNEHPDTTDRDIELIPYAVEVGRVIFESRREQWLAIDYIHPDCSDHHYILAVKCNRAGDAIYARSLHRLRPRQIEMLPRRGYVLRPYTERDRATPRWSRPIRMG